MRTTSMSRRLATLAVVALAAVGAGASTAHAAAPAPAPNGNWTVTSRVHNNTPYTMKFSQLHLNQCTTRRNDPYDIPPGGSSNVTFDNDCIGRGVETQLTYDLVNAQGKNVGYVRAVANLEWKFSWDGYEVNVHGIVGSPGVSSRSTWEGPQKTTSSKWLQADTTFSGGSAQLTGGS